MSGAAARTATSYQHTFHGRPDQVRQVRRDIARHLAGCPAVDNVILVASELATNSIVHSASAGEFFTVRCQAFPGHIRVEVEDLGGKWHGKADQDRPHGLAIIDTLAGSGNWGVEDTAEGNRIVWARLIPDA